MNMKRMLSAVLTFVVLLTLACAPALAKVVSPGREFYYLDDANVLSEATEGEIFFSNQLLDEACGAQFCVVTVKTTGSTAIDDYAYELFNAWGIGDSQKDNGCLLILAIDDDNYYALCGSNLQPKLTSGRLQEYFDEYLEDDFAAKRYDEGARRFFEEVFDFIATAYDADVTTSEGIAKYLTWKRTNTSLPAVQPNGGRQPSGVTSSSSAFVGGFGVIAFVLIIILVIVLISRRRRRRFLNPGGVNVHPIIINNPTPPPPPPMSQRPGPGGYRGRQNVGRPSGGLFGGGFSGLTSRPSRPSGNSRPSGGLFGGSFGSSSHSSGSGRSSGGSRSFGSSRGGGGSSRGGGAGRGRH